jgi:hypothetical protein
MNSQDKAACVCLIYCLIILGGFAVAYYGYVPYTVTVSDVSADSSRISFTLHVLFRHLNVSVYITGVVLNNTVIVMPYFTQLMPGDTLRLTIPGNYTTLLHFHLMLLSDDVQHVYSIPFDVNAQIKNGSLT